MVPLEGSWFEGGERVEAEVQGGSSSGLGGDKPGQRGAVHRQTALLPEDRC